MLERYAHKRGTELERSIQGGRPRWILRLPGGVGADGRETPGRSWVVRQQVDIGSKEGVDRASRPDFVIAPRDGDPSVLPIAVFCDGAAFHVTPERETGVIAADVAKRRALIESERYRVWSLTWGDLEAWIRDEDVAVRDAFSEPSRSVLGHLWDQRAAGPLKQGLLTKGSASLFFAHLEHPDAAHWSAVAEVNAAAWALSGPFLEARDAAEMRERLISDGADVGGFLVAVHKKPDAEAPWVSRGHVGQHALTFARLPTSSVHGGVSAGAEIVVRLLDHQNHRQSRGFVAWWRSFLWAWNLLQFHGSASFLSSEFVEAEGPALEVAQPVKLAQLVAEPASLAVSVTTDVAASPDAELEELLEIATSWSAPVIREAFERGLPLPEVGWVLEGSSAHEADIAWPEQRLVVLAESQAGSRGAFEGAGFLVFEYPVDRGELLGALAERSAVVQV